MPELSPQSRTWIRMVIDYAPPAASLVAYLVYHDVLVATWWLVGVSLLAILASYVLERRLAPLPVIFGAMALVFGGLTLIFQNRIFIQLKPSIVDVALGSGLLIGLAMGKSPIRLIVGDNLALSEAGWKSLTLRFGLFFLVLAALNLVVMYYCSFQFWLFFRFPGILIFTLLFAFTQMPMMIRDAKALEAAGRAAETQQ